MRVYLGLGSNLGDREAHLRKAILRLADAGLPPQAVSTVYETEPQGKTDQDWFLNCVVAADTEWTPERLLAVVREIEEAAGRRRVVRWGPRVLDVDILLYGERRIQTSDLEVPHPRLHERAFVLVPLCEVAPDVVIPGHGAARPLAVRRAAEAGQGLRPWGRLGCGAGAPRPTRARLLAALEASASGPVSGAVLAAQLGVTRAAVWKHVQRLRAAGYDIQGDAGLGYRLRGAAPEDVAPLRPEALVPEGPHGLGPIHVVASVDSTNRWARRLGLEGAPAGTVVVAEAQTEGRGRGGRGFLSPPGGLYTSVLLRPQIVPAQAARLTLLGALAVSQALDAWTPQPTAIKWPNDILLPAGKVCGILLELVGREDRLDFVVLGVGINVRTAPAGVGATSLWDVAAHVSRAEVGRAVLGRLDRLYREFQAGGWPGILQAWRLRCSTLGRLVRIDPVLGPPVCGRAVGVTDDGALQVEVEGVVETVFAGDVRHLRPADPACGAPTAASRGPAIRSPGPGGSSLEGGGAGCS